MYPNAASDYDRSFDSESKTKHSHKALEADELLNLLRSHSREIQEFIHRLNTAVPEEGFGIMRIALWTDTLEDHKELLTQIMRRI